MTSKSDLKLQLDAQARRLGELIADVSAWETTINRLAERVVGLENAGGRSASNALDLDLRLGVVEGIVAGSTTWDSSAVDEIHDRVLQLEWAVAHIPDVVIPTVVRDDTPPHPDECPNIYVPHGGTVQIRTDIGWANIISTPPPTGTLFIPADLPAEDQSDLVDRIVDQIRLPRVRMNLVEPEACEEGRDPGQPTIWADDPFESETTSDASGPMDTTYWQFEIPAGTFQLCTELLRALAAENSSVPLNLPELVLPSE